LFKQDRSKFFLHFHLESHDRCDVRLKPSHWDKGTYFRSELLTNGALRLIPHFISIPSCRDEPRKRPLPTTPITDVSIVNSRPQKRSVDPFELPTSTAIVNMTEDALASEDEDLAKEEAFEHSQSVPRATRGGTHYDHGTFIPRYIFPLPQRATYSNWVIDFAAAKQRDIDAHYGGITPFPKSTREKTTSYTAHGDMIHGKYGMTSLKPCSHCIRAGEVCRVYHSECYEWSIHGQNAKQMLGWRCERCRLQCERHEGGCNAQHHA
jgi:hypothetical protein